MRFLQNMFFCKIFVCSVVFNFPFKMSVNIGLRRLCFIKYKIFTANIQFLNVMSSISVCTDEKWVCLIILDCLKR